MEYISLNGNWNVIVTDAPEVVRNMILPGTLDENQIGHKDIGNSSLHPDAALGNTDDITLQEKPITTRFTRKFTYEGEAKIFKKLLFKEKAGKRTFLEVERARCLKLLIDDQPIPEFMPSSLDTPYIYEVTGLLDGEHEITLLSDNSYKALPHDAIVYSSTATDETQTNWNGILGYIRLREEDSCFISDIRVYPTLKEADIAVLVQSDVPRTITLSLASDALLCTNERTTQVAAGENELWFRGCSFKEDITCWDLEAGFLYTMSASLLPSDSESKKSVQFGIRTFSDPGIGKLALNGRTIFLRSEANCAVFPETGYPPMTVEEWTKVLHQYRAYGVNCMRFHSYCPPDAAFTAADRIGMLMQPELSHWNPNDAFESDESYHYYRRELIQIITYLANHPSFVMLTFGNELQAGNLGHSRMKELLKLARSIDATRLYANGSNLHYGHTDCEQESDFCTEQSHFDKALRGTFAEMKGYINEQYPNARTNYNASMEALRETYKKPVFGFEVGQFEVLPDFEELSLFKGISEPVNYRVILDRVIEKGLLSEWNSYVEATGELSKLCYREEIEAAMRTKDFSGISLLGLQDFPGQGTALVGMMNSHLEPKPYAFASPSAFEAFFRDRLPLILLDRYTYYEGEEFDVPVLFANYGKTDIEGIPTYELKGHTHSFKGQLEPVQCLVGTLTSIGTIHLHLPKSDISEKYELSVQLNGNQNTYPLWVYKDVHSSCPASVYQTATFNEQTIDILKKGGIVYLSPKSTKEAMEHSIQAQFSTDFWSVGTFTKQEGGMGQLIDTSHRIFQNFPTESHTNWQWWIMASQRAFVLPKKMKAIVTEMDSYATLRPMAQLFECNCLNGKILISSFGLQDLQQYPEAKALLHSLYTYMDSDAFLPVETMTPEEIAILLGK